LPAQHTQEHLVEVGDLCIISNRKHPRHDSWLRCTQLLLG
jgi:hypothetical protein